MSYIQNFKKFMKSEEKKTAEAGANPTVAEQTATATTPATTTTPTDTAQTDTSQTDTSQPAPQVATPSVESDPAVIAARTKLTMATANRDKAIAAKQDELNKLKTAQDAIVNTAMTDLNNAMSSAAKKTS